MSFPSSIFRQGESSNRFANAYSLPRQTREAIINPMSTYTGVFTPGMPLKVVSYTGGILIIDVSAQNDSQPQHFLSPELLNGKIAINGVAPAAFQKGDKVTVFQTLGEKEYDFLYTVKTGVSVSALGNATYEIATNRVKPAGPTDIIIGKFIQSGGGDDVVKVCTETAGLSIQPTITTLV